ncbi:recombination protein RecR [Candidatus Peregrinibacteria bacterium]|nr:recombination protein RecR [Candidatus Peregrinibacteria bacterium]
MLPKSLQKLIDAFAKLPGVGKKTAQRYAYFLLRSHRSLSRDIGESLLHLQENIALCRECYMISEAALPGSASLCSICINPRRDQSTVCVVEHVFDAEAIERSGEYRGVYHVLHGRIAPLDNVTPDDLKIKELLMRIKRINGKGGALEIILATNPSSEGETTAFYIQKLLKPLGIKLTRIATGIPVGADLEYADELTLARALKGRQNYE